MANGDSGTRGGADPVECFRAGIDAVLRQPVPLLVSALIVLALSGGPSFTTSFGDARIRLGVPFWSALVGGPLWYGLLAMGHRVAGGAEAQIPEVFDAFRSGKRYGNAVIASLLSSFAVGIGLLLLVLPGIYLMIRLFYVPALVMVEGADGVEALRESWRRTEGRELDVLLFGLLGFGAMIAGVLLCCVGTIPAAAVLAVAYGRFYSLTARA
ncbi:hypothetical protein L6R50_01690 [Myxococcota bacterium]|nr:hypothetical protein [Myxococcota bacterium]